MTTPSARLRLRRCRVEILCHSYLQRLARDHRCRYTVGPLAHDLEDRREYLRELLSVMRAYVLAVLRTWRERPRDPDLRQVEALFCDLTCEVWAP